ncbi:MAG: hypothetical protein ACLFTS_00145 [Candidatus Paceibacterota bacterium]
MIILLYGNSFKKRKKRIKEITDSLKKKRPNTQVFSLDEESFGVSDLEELLFSSGLFDEKHIVLLRAVLKNKEYSAFILKHLDLMADSGHVFIFSELDISPAYFKKIKDKAYITEKTEEKEEKKEVFNNFDIADAVGEKNAPKAWKLFQTALMLGKDPEELLAVITWIIKSMQAASCSLSAQEAGMKDYPYKKAKRYAENFQNRELEEISLELLSASLQSRKGKTPLHISLEKLLLEL